MKVRVSIVGSVGLPANYGGFETLVSNLVYQNALNGERFDIEVYCSSLSYRRRPKEYGGARLRYIPVGANGPQSILYDIWAAIDATVRGTEVVLLLGTSGALILPILRLLTRVRLITNIDGMEWRRDKWGGFARRVLRTFERLAVRFSHVVVADNTAIGHYLQTEYGASHVIIPYGGDHSRREEADTSYVAHLPSSYALALCRIEPENNVSMILEAFSMLNIPLVFVGNWDRNDYGRELKVRHQDNPNIRLLDAVYEPRALRAIRDRATIYVHGHSEGGTNPSLVEMMHFGIPIVAYECTFNRYTTEDSARYFNSAAELADAVRNMTLSEGVMIGEEMTRIARSRYTWEIVAKAYFKLLDA